MFPDSRNPFAAAAAPKNGAAPSPFQPATNGSPAPSPFEAAGPVQNPQTSLPEPKASASPGMPASPFALVEDAAPNQPSPFGPDIAEPTEGFAAHEAVPQRLNSPAPVAMPETRVQNGMSGNVEDPFAAPAPGSQPQSQPRRADFVLPAERPQAAPVQTPAPAGGVRPGPGQTTPAAATPAVVAAVTGETSQLVLRAIFGVTRELDKTEILQRARTLPGIRNLQVVGQTEAAAMASLRNSVQRMGFGDSSTLFLATSGGVVDIIEETGTTLAVLHEGTYAAGVRETLIIVSRELGRLG